MTDKKLKLLKNFLYQLKAKASEDSAQSLVYAFGLLNRQIYTIDNPLKQVAIIGPTQAGKSTLVNLLIGADDAEVSTRAAFTRKAHGFTQNTVDEPLKTYLKKLFSYTDTANSSNAAEFSIKQVENSKLTNTIVWDTADFDSVAAGEYKASSLLLYALADVVVLVVSKEKYADLAVWQTLRLAKDTNQTLLVFINKVDPVNEHETIKIVADKFTKEKIKIAGIYTLPYVGKNVEQQLQDNTAIVSASEFINARLPDNESSSDNLKAFLNRHWENWTHDLENEIAARKIWQQNVEQALKVAADSYAKDYLQNPIYAETMQQIMLKLLKLLEIPKLANTLGKLRAVVTWPARTLFEKIKPQLTDKDSLPNHETLVLQELQQNCATSLLRQIGDLASAEGAQHWWLELWQVFKAQEPSFSDDFKQQIIKHQQEFAPEIAQAAEDIYQSIKTEPVTLNSLRAARVSADALAVIVALKTGGIGAHDLLLTPAMLAFTSLITESAVGQYLKKIEAKLKAKQAQSVQNIIFEHYNNKLLMLPDKISAPSVYGIQLDELNKMRQIVKSL